MSAARALLAPARSVLRVRPAAAPRRHLSGSGAATALARAASVAEPPSAPPALAPGLLLSDTGAHYLQALHGALSPLPWAASLAAAAVAIRLLSLPLLYHHQVHAGRAALAAPELVRVRAFVRRTPGSLWRRYRTFRRLRALALQAAGTASLRAWRWDLAVHLPVVVSASMGIRSLAADAPPEWTDGGAAWFADLTVPDPTGVLPVVTTAFWLWNCSPRAPLVKPRAEARPDGEGEGGGKENAAINRVMSARGEWVSTLLQVVSVASLAVTMDLPSGIVLLWVSNGAVTALQRWAFSNDAVRRHIGLLTAQDIAASSGPPVLQSTKTAVDRVRRELEYVQREVLARFPNRKVDEDLRGDINKVLRREVWNRRISMQLEAVVREDDVNGKKYIAVIRKGTA